jgi:hypothetical protein
MLWGLINFDTTLLCPEAKISQSDVIFIGLAGLDPCWSQTHYVGFVMTRFISFFILDFWNSCISPRNMGKGGAVYLYGAVNSVL